MERSIRRITSGSTTNSSTTNTALPNRMSVDVLAFQRDMTFVSPEVQDACQGRKGWYSGALNSTWGLEDAELFPAGSGCTKPWASYTNGQSTMRACGGNTSLYLRPKNLDDAVALLNSSGGQILAGGTDFYPALGERVPKRDVVDISGLCEIRGISAEQRHFRIGGLTTWTEVVRVPLPHCFDAVKAAAREIGSVQIQNRGTVAELVQCVPAADSVPPR